MAVEMMIMTVPIEIFTSHSDAEGSCKMSHLLNQPKPGIGNCRELLAGILDLDPVVHRPVSLLCEHLVAVL